MTGFTVSGLKQNMTAMKPVRKELVNRSFVLPT